MVSSVEIISNGPAPHNLQVIVGFDATNKVSVDLDSNVRSLLTGQNRNNPVAISAAASDWLQMLVDAGPPGSSRQLLTDLPVDDPDRTIDPARPSFFHARIDPSAQLGNGPNAVDIYRPTALVGGVATHLIGRAFLVEFEFDGTDYTIRTYSGGPGFKLR
jgi:hypothetical protein